MSRVACSSTGSRKGSSSVWWLCESTPAGHRASSPNHSSGLRPENCSTPETARRVATKRAVTGVLQFSGLNPLEWFGDDARWPADVDSQSHQSVGDPFRDPVEDQAAADVRAAGGTLELFDYPGDGHLFTDPTLPDEYDAASTELMWSRVLPFVAARG